MNHELIEVAATTSTWSFARLPFILVAFLVFVDPFLATEANGLISCVVQLIDEIRLVKPYAFEAALVASSVYGAGEIGKDGDD